MAYVRQKPSDLTQVNAQQQAPIISGSGLPSQTGITPAGSTVVSNAGPVIPTGSANVSQNALQPGQEWRQVLSQMPAHEIPMEHITTQRPLTADEIAKRKAISEIANRLPSRQTQTTVGLPQRIPSTNVT